MGTIPHAQAGATVLVVDDDIDQLNIMRMSLEHAGYEAFTAANGPDALDYVRSQRVDVIQQHDAVVHDHPDQDDDADHRQQIERCVGQHQHPDHAQRDGDRTDQLAQ